MSDLIQIVYISRSTFKPLAAEQGIEPSVARILAQSRMNNAKRGLVGALYFGDECFFQCLEGRTAAVDRLYAALLEDPRHTDLKVLSRHAIDKTTFSTWSMKYVPLDAPMKELMERRGLTSFDPYRFDDATVADVLQMLKAGGDLSTVDPGRSVDQPFAVRAAPAGADAPRASRWLLVAAVLAVVAAGAWALLKGG